MKYLLLDVKQSTNSTKVFEVIIKIWKIERKTKYSNSSYLDILLHYNTSIIQISAF